MWGTMIFLSNKKYNLEWMEVDKKTKGQKMTWEQYLEALGEENRMHRVTFLERFDSFYFDTEIPETYFCDITDERMQHMYQMELKEYDTEHLKKLKEYLAKDPDCGFYQRQFEKYSKPVPTIEEYINSLREYVVHDGKVFAVQNIIDGKMDFFSQCAWSDLRTKDGRKAACVKVKELDLECEALQMPDLVIYDEDLSYESIESCANRKEEAFYEKVKKLMKTLPEEKYVYSFGYHY